MDQPSAARRWRRVREGGELIEMCQALTVEAFGELAGAEDGLAEIAHEFGEGGGVKAEEMMRGGGEDESNSSWCGMSWRRVVEWASFLLTVFIVEAFEGERCLWLQNVGFS